MLRIADSLKCVLTLLAAASLATGCASAAPADDPSLPAPTSTESIDDAGSAATPDPSAPDAALVLEDASSPEDPAAPEDAGAADAAKSKGAGPTNPCPALKYPSGVKIQTFENAAMTATYAKHLASGESAPKCFLDVDDLIDPDTEQVYPLTVNVAAHFMLEELVGTEVSEGYGHLVLMAPAAVASLEKFREALNTPVSVNSGFRSPKHQEDVCTSLCGDPLGCSGTCANNSRHMFGDAVDLPLQFYTTADEHLACSVGFKFAYLESGTHLHVDQNPAYATCVIE